MWSIFWNGSNFIRYSRPKKAFIQYLNYRIDLLSGDKVPGDLSLFLSELKKNKLSSKKKLKVMHLYYELGYLLNDLSFDNETVPLAIDLEYSNEETWSPSKVTLPLGLVPKKAVSKNSYQRDFDMGWKHLMRGDCYQYNLSYEFEYEITKNINAEGICSRLWRDSKNISPYAHATFLESLDELILSNSPECLFQARVNNDSNSVWTMPIKGTMPLGKNWKKSFKKLLNSKKDRGELDMITDLLRNDLSRIENQISKVVKRRAPLIVPKIVHQYSLIETNVSHSVSLFDVLRAVFPGGSITGAPKRSVMKILRNLEKRNRGIYCGSTIFFNGDKCCSSINIRTALINLKSRTLNYSAGGGITLLSNSEDEFLEMHLKKESFVRNL